MRQMSIRLRAVPFVLAGALIASQATAQGVDRELAGIARLLGLATAPIPEGPVPYDPDLYQSVYERVLTHRQAQVLHVTTRLPTRELSVYDFAIPRTDLLPTAGEAASFIREVERTYPELQALELEVDRWYLS